MSDIKDPRTHDAAGNPIPGLKPKAPSAAAPAKPPAPGPRPATPAPAPRQPAPAPKPSPRQPPPPPSPPANPEHEAKAKILDAAASAFSVVAACHNLAARALRRGDLAGAKEQLERAVASADNLDHAQMRATWEYVDFNPAHAQPAEAHRVPEHQPEQRPAATHFPEARFPGEEGEEKKEQQGG